MDRYDVIATKAVVQDLIDISDHIASQLLAPETADDTINTLYEAMQTLDFMPKRNPLACDTHLSNLGYRIMPVKSHLVFYTVYDLPKPEVYIERILYNKRDWQGLLKPNDLGT